MKTFTAAWITFFAFSSIFIVYNEGGTPAPKRCAVPDCSEPISRARTKVRYFSPDNDRVSFKAGQDVDVFIKRGDTWGIKVGDRFGYAPASFLKEVRVLVASTKLVDVPEDAAAEPPKPEPVKIETSQKDSVDVAIEKTEEITGSVGSLLSFPSVAAAENVDGQQGSVPTPSSPQYEMHDGTTIWLDPIPPIQPNMQYAPGNTEAEPQSAENSSERVPETLQNSISSSDQPPEAVSDPSLVPSSYVPENAEVADESPSTDVPVASIPEVNLATPPSFVDGPTEVPQQETSTEATTEPSQEVTTETSVEASVETTSDASPAVVTGSVTETPETSTEGQDIEPTQAGIMSNLWNTMFNSGDGTEENSQENDGEEVEDDDGEEEEGDDDDDGGDDEDVEENSTEKGVPPTLTPQSEPAVESTSVSPTSGEIVENIVVGLSSTASPDELASSFPQAQVDNVDDAARIPRQTENFSGEVITEERDGAQGTQISGEGVETTSSENVVQEEMSASTASITQEDAVHQAKEEEERKEKEKEILRQQEEEKKLQQEMENQRQQEEVAKRQQEEAAQQEEAKRLQEEAEAKRLQEEAEAKRLQEEAEAKRLQEEAEAKRLQEEAEAKRLQEEAEAKRLQEEAEAKRLQEEAEAKLQKEELSKRQQEEEIKQQQEEEFRRQQEDAARMQALEEENRIALEAEQELRRKNEEIQRLQEEETRKQRDEAYQKQVQEALLREKEKAVKEVLQPTAESNQTESTSESSPPNPETATDSEEPETPSVGMFSWVSGMFGSSVDTENVGSEANNEQPQLQESQLQNEAHPTTEPLPISHNHHEHLHEHPPVWSSEHQTMCSASEAGCEMTGPEAEEALGLFGIQTPSLDVILLRLAATALALFLGAVSFYFLRKKHVDSILVAKINELEKQLLVASKEAVILREEQVTVDSGLNDEEINSLREELESSRLVRADLEEQVSTLERELEEATETGIELNKLLSETLEASKGKAHAGLAASVERLQQQLDSQRDKVDSLTRSLKSTSGENENLKSLVAESKERISALEAELNAAAEIANNIRREKEEANVLVAQELQQVQSRLEEALSSKVLEESRLGSELSALKLKHETLRSSLSMKDAEVKALQDTLKQLESGEGNQLLDITKVKAEIEHTKSERDMYLAKYEEEEKGRKDLEVRLDKITETLKTLEEKVDVADKCKEEAETRLAVLSNYFKEKEEQLQKELGLKEAIVAQHRGDESTVVKHLQLLQEEVNTYKAQNESLKQEILDQERDFKGQIATLEKKAHDNWMTARQAERRLEDSRQEAAQLRNRLTIVEKSNADPNARLDANGDGGVASPVMMMPLPPLGDMETPPPLPPFMFSPPPYPPPFMPPPLPPHPMGRPPPLGRMSSPPPPLGQFSPPPPPYDRLDRSSRSRSPSPPHHRYHHRSPPPPQQWDAPPSSFRPVPKPSPKKPSDQRDHKGSMHNSGHLNDSTDKSREHV